MNRRHQISLVIILGVLLGGCTANKYLPEGKKYYDGASVKWSSGKDVSGKDRRNTVSEIEEVIRPEPNMKFLGMRPKAWFYHIAGDVEKEKGFKYWLKYKIGGEPVYLEDVNYSQVNRLIRNRLEINGFFLGSSSPQINEKEHSATIQYAIQAGNPYRYDTIAPLEGESVLADSIRDIQQHEDNNLKKGDRYDFNTLELERGRIEGALKNEGYFFFDQRFILYRADSTVVPEQKRVALFPTLKDNLTDKAETAYSIDKVTVYADYFMDMEDSLNIDEADTTRVNDVTYISRNNYFRPEIITDQVRIRPGERYNRTEELRTINRLIQLDVFRLVNVEYSEQDSSTLNANVYLSPYKKKSLRLELSAVTTSQSFAGPHLQVTFRNRNFLKGAERYELSFTGNYEWQIGGKRSTSSERTSDQNINLLNSFELGVTQTLLIPRLITPFNIDYSNANYIPQTRFGLSFKWLQRVGYYQFNSAETSYGFQWRETLTKRHRLDPVSITYIRLGSTTEEFDEILEQNEILRRSLEDQFIVGSNYSFFYSSQEDPELKKRKNNFYFNGNLGIAGNLLYLAHEAAGSPKDSTVLVSVDPETMDSTRTVSYQHQVFGLPFAQYVRVELDFRHYYDFDENNRLASRLIMGSGYSYGNSETMPYSKQFSVGGASSLRGFRSRSIGPGTYQGDSTVSFVDQTGEIRLEFNTEWRFTILNQIKGALFFDIGNIWTFREDPDRPGSEFKADKFLDQLAMSAGAGIRYDADIFVLRFDFGVPLKVPYEGGVDRSPVLNIAIGYPF